MERNTFAFVESQKPILVIDPHGNPFAEARTAPVSRIVLDLYNRGGTTAFHCIQHTWVELVANEVTDAGFSFNSAAFAFTSAADYQVSDTPLSVYPNHSATQLNTPIRHGDLTPDERLAIEKAQLIICIRVRFEFRDAFNPKRFADFGFWVTHQGLGHLAKYQDSN